MVARRRSPIHARIPWLLAFVLILSLLQAPARAQGTDASGTCDQFMRAMQSKNWQAAYSYFSKGFQQTHPYQGWSLMYATYAPMFTIEHWHVSVQEKGDKASGTISLTSRSGGDESHHDDAVEMVKENGEWKISEYK